MASKKNPVIFDEPVAPVTSVTENLAAPAKSSGEVSLLHDANANIVYLPSEGRLGYPEVVEYRDILVRDEEVLASATRDTYSKTLNSVIKSVMNDCPFYEKMTIYDRDFMLVWIWANNYSSKKDVTVECAHCGHSDSKVVDLTNLDSTKVSENIPVPFELEIKTGKVFINLNTVADELFVEDYIRRNKKTTYKYEHLMMVRSIDVGVDMDFTLKLKWVSENITGKQMGVIRAFHRHYAYGINPTIEHTCSACGEVTHGDVPFQTEDVLHPTVPTDFA